MVETAYLLVLPYDSDVIYVPCPLENSVITYSSEKPFLLLGAMNYTYPKDANFLRISMAWFMQNSLVNSLMYTIAGGSMIDTINVFRNFGKLDYIQPGSYKIDIEY